MTIISARDSDFVVVVMAHGAGIWVVDSLAPDRACDALRSCSVFFRICEASHSSHVVAGS